MTQRSPDVQALLKRSLIQLQAAQARLDEADRRAHEPIAIIGIGCRFPGDITDPRGYLRLLLAGVDTVTELPAERWPIDDFYDPDPDRPGTTYCRHGSYLADVDRFEPRCFGISPREAAGMDPQQRLLLEVAWEAIERSGRAPAALHGSRTGVFVGVMGQDYTQLATRTPAQIDAHTGAGNSLSVAAGRLSHCFGLVGPSLAIDTACSSSLVAVHLAIRALRSGDAELALAGGVNLALSPVATLIESRSRMLAASGRCRTFDDAADGIVRGEGCALVLLRRLSHALADGDPIVAVLRGSAVNHDGRTSGLTVPSGPAQERVLREALADARTEPAAIGYVEAHGTGTPLGDPIELEALAAVHAGAPRAHALRVGSVKTNMGHLEGAAGVAGLIKAALCVAAGELAPHLHLRTPSRRVDWPALGLAVPTAREPWPAGQPRLAGVSSFGFSGTNAHVVVEAPPARAPASDPRPVQLLTLSARSPAALVDLARALAGRLLELGDADFADACHTARVGRSDFEYRLALLAPDAATAAGSLRRFAAGEREHLICGRRPAVAPALAFAFAGQGAHHPGMGRELAAREPVFAAELRRNLEAAQPGLTRPLVDVIAADDGALDETEHTQPALVALELALVRLLAGFGVRPDAALGYSVGEYAAAITAGVLEPADGLRLVTARGLGMRDLPERGGMLAVHADADAVEALLRRHPRLVIAGRNGPRSTVVSGPAAALAALVAELTDHGPGCKPLPVSHAFHSPLMEPMRAGFERALAAVPLARPNIAFISTLTGREVDEAAATPAYWSRQIVAPVRFADAVLAMRARGLELVIEVGPRPTLQQLGRQIVDDAALRWLPTLDPRDPQALHRTLAELWVRGVAVDWPAYDRGRGHRRLELPTHPFARERCWLDGPPPWRPAAAPPMSRSLLGERLESPALPPTTTVFAATWTSENLPWLADHRVHGIAVVPAAAFVALAVEAGARVLGTRALRLDAAAIHQPLAPAAGRPTHVQTILERTDVALRCRVLGRAGDDPGEWTSHFECTLAPTASASATRPPDGGEALPVADLYAAFATRGVEHGPALRVLEHLRRGPDWTLATAAIDPSAPGGPAIAIDACLQTAAALASADDTHIPVGVDAIAVYGPLPARLTIHARRAAMSHNDAATPGAAMSNSDAATPGAAMSHSDAATPSAAMSHNDAATPGAATSNSDAATRSDIDVHDESGRLWARFTGLTVRRAAAGSLQRALAGDTRAWTYRRAWRPAERGEAPLPTRWWIFADAAGVGARLAAALVASGCTCTVVRRDDPDAPDNFDAHRAQLADVDAIAWLWGLDGDPGPTPDAAGLARARALGCLGLVDLLRALDRPTPPRLVVLTAGAVALHGDAPPRLDQAALWGLAQGIASERPEFRCLRVDLSAHRDPADDLLAALTLDDGEDQIAVRGPQLHVPRLERAALRPAGRPHIRPDGTYVIAGGPGGLGLALADWLVGLGARRLVLLARRDPGPAARARLDALVAAGVELRLARVDLAERADVAALFAGLREVRGIFHAAGQLHDAALTHQSAASLDAAARAKVEGAWNLHACAPAGLDFFVAFSSVAALLGTPGQANYAAANAALGALATVRRAHGLPALTIEWGSFADAGMAARLGARTDAMSHSDTIATNHNDTLATSTARPATTPPRTLGLTPMPIAAGLHALEQFLATPAAELPPTLAVFAVDWRQLGRALPAAAGQRIFSAFLEPPRRRDDSGSADLRARLAAAPPRRRHELLQDVVAGEVAAVLGIRGAIGPRDRLFDLGVDSLLALEIRARLGHRLGHALRATLVFDFPTVDDLTRHAAQELGLVLVDPAPAADVEDAMTTELRALSDAQLTDLIDRELDSLLRGDP